jgi:hypothetical protein
MKRILSSLLFATLPFGSALADAPESQNAKGLRLRVVAKRAEREAR